jgi:RNA polymerase sigma-70 factor (ECF subfamily)
MTVISAELGLAAAASPLEGGPCARPAGAMVSADPVAAVRPVVAAPPPFEEIYEEHFDFVWRGLRRLGVPAASIDDAVPDVFLVVHRRLADFEGRSSLKTWVFGIAVRVARDHQRLLRRKGWRAPLDTSIPDAAPGPIELFARAEAVRELDRILGTLDEDKRAVFILAEIEQMAAPEIAETLGVKMNTVYSRLRAARRAVEAALAPPRGGRR